MPRVLKIDPRPPSYDSVAEAVFASEDEGRITDDVESDVWRPIAQRTAAAPQIAFVDGVERRDARVSAEGEGQSLLGLLVSYAAGAICPGRQPALRHVSVQRRVVLTRGARPQAIRMEADNTSIEYLPAHDAEEDAESLDRTLKELRADREAEVVRCLIVDGVEMIVVDGRLPPIRHPSAVGFIKTPHRLPLSKQEQLDVLAQLKPGERSPVFVRERSARAYYSWFLCLQPLGRLHLAFSNLALLELDDGTPRQQAIETADVTAAILPPYASSSYRDPRAPQNLLPVGQLERELRHRLGDPELLKRLMLATFTKEAPAWEP